jgi:hypothetical protein
LSFCFVCEYLWMFRFCGFILVTEYLGCLGGFYNVCKFLHSVSQPQLPWDICNLCNCHKPCWPCHLAAINGMGDASCNAFWTSCSVVRRMTLSYSILDVASVTNVKACPVCGGYTVLHSSVSQVNSLRAVILAKY